MDIMYSLFWFKNVFNDFFFDCFQFFCINLQIFIGIQTTMGNGEWEPTIAMGGKFPNKDEGSHEYLLSSLISNMEIMLEMPLN